MKTVEQIINFLECVPPNIERFPSDDMFIDGYEAAKEDLLKFINGELDD